MPLYVRDESVNALAEQARTILKAPTKTEAIRLALQRVIQEELAKPTLGERVARLREKYALADHASLRPFDDRSFLDQMWGDTDVRR